MTYLPPANGGRINATISGNTAGAGALVSSGTLTLAGGNNITLSQAGNAITISGGAAGGAAGTNTLGMSNIGNTAGNTGVISGSALQFAFAGGNNVTLSQSLNASSGTITISAANQTVQTQNLFNLTLTGNTSGVLAGVSSGTLSLAGGNNITLSQAGNAVTISGASQSVQTQNLHNVTLAGNTSGALAQVSSGTLTLAGGNNVTLSQAGNAVTISAANQSVQTQNLFDVTLAGNTTGTLALVSSGTLSLAGGNNITLSQAGNAITISGGAGGGIALANSQTTYNTGTANLIEGGGAITIASTTGQSFKVSVPQTSSLSATGIMSISTNGSTISIGAPPLSQWQHNSAAMYSSATSAMVNASVSLVRMILPAVSFSRIDIPMTISGGTQSSANTAAVAVSAVGVLYSRNASTLNAIVGQSSSTTYSYASNSGVYSSLTGPRLMSFNLATSLSAGEYYMGLQFSTAASSIGTATTAPGWTMGPIFGSTYTVLPWQDMSAATNQTINLYQPLQGMNSVSISATSQTHQQSQITQSGATAIRANIIVILRNQ